MKPFYDFMNISRRLILVSVKDSMRPGGSSEQPAGREVLIKKDFEDLRESHSKHWILLYFSMGKYCGYIIGQWKD